ncbi:MULTISPECIES: N-acyl-D-amino-acid deacylase family protein [Flavobacteriaceae]|uniref:N-acyl-D-amino-acid deacylase family protein n=1 Tax=Flavobacteriaceae TaxID=49546 RepID=UPI00149244BB|nr:MULTISPECIES: amidohydrolase family protein [Allomuricauda]MDC6366069.1 amidohydrolase family protein [Muricauda sp. AC10]
MKSICKVFILTLLFLPFLICCGIKKIEADILIKNGLVYDGVSTKPSKNSIVVKGDKIIHVGDLSGFQIVAKKTINASELIVCPGFIDPHTHADRDLNKAETSHNKPFLFQGITTVVVGNDGASFYPLKEFKALYNAQGIGTNVVPLVGHGTIREQIMGKSDKLATAAEIKKMQQLVDQEMKAGAFGISTGLFYSPGSYSNTEEVIALAKIAAENGGIYDTHLRDESSYNVGLMYSIEEAIEIGRQAKLPIHISHIKCLGVDVWDKSKAIIDLIEKAHEEGLEITANQYPYSASATGLKAAVVPRWAESGGKDSLFIRYNDPKLKNKILTEINENIARRGGAEKLLIVKSKKGNFIGKNLLQISNMLDLPANETVIELLKSGYVRVASFNMANDDILTFMKQDWIVTGSDGNTGHPRKFGSFPRKFHTYVAQKKIIDTSRFINSSSAKTAEIFKIDRRGKLKKDYYADIIIFDPKTFRDKADYTNAFQLSEGLVYSILNGKITIENGKYNNTLNGKVLKKRKP